MPRHTVDAKVNRKKEKEKEKGKWKTYVCAEAWRRGDLGQLIMNNLENGNDNVKAAENLIDSHL